LKPTLSQGVLADSITIGQLSQTTGVPASTIRYWERLGVLPRPARRSGQRRYTNHAIQHLAVLQLAQACGFRLDEMRELASGFRADRPPSARWRELAASKAAEIDTQLARLLAMKEVLRQVAGCQCIDWDECGYRAAAALGGKNESPR
jgi:MerR family redox-sensitive transcriptional activator SoxR